MPKMTRDGTKARSFTISPLDADWLEETCRMIRMNSGENFSQSELLRGILRAVREKGIDFSSATSEEEIARQLSKIIKR